ncbi:MAG: hypothetical protein ACYTFA_14725 [Planctomycetota bacterium]|jgi:hypothetical protein
MTSTVADSKLRLLLAAITAVCLLVGCTLGTAKVSHHQHRPADAGEARDRTPGAADADLDAQAQPNSAADMLAAVQEFLERTEDYEWPPSTGPSAGVSTAAWGQTSATSPRPVNACHIDTPEFEHGEGLRVSSDIEGRSISSNRDPGFLSADGRSDAPPAAVANTWVALTDPEPPQSPLALPVVQSVSIREAVRPVFEAEVSIPSSTSNQPLDVQFDDATVSADRFLEQLETQAHEADDFDSLWQLLLVQVAMKRVVDPPEPAPSLSAEAQRILSGLIRLIVSARAAARNPLLLGEEALLRADEFRQLLADRADPEVSAVTMCRKVVTFGRYEEMDSDEFVAGRRVQTIVYSEIRNLRSEQTPDGQYRTVLRTRLAVLSEEGEPVWQHEEPEIQDLCRRRRTDFFIAQRITLPATLGEGNYVLKVFAEDKLSGKANEASYQFTVHSPHSVAANR